MNGHSLHYEGEKLSITGVKEVKSMEDRELSLLLTDGTLTIKGNNLTVDELNIAEGKINARGTITSLAYSGGKENFFKKVFR